MAIYTRSDYSEARELLAKAARVVQERPNALGASILRWQAETERRGADIRRARDLAEQARVEFDELGDPIGASDCLRLLADCHLEGTGTTPPPTSCSRPLVAATR